MSLRRRSPFCRETGRQLEWQNYHH